jgi:hypothetical protein
LFHLAAVAFAQLFSFLSLAPQDIREALITTIETLHRLQVSCSPIRLYPEFSKSMTGSYFTFCFQFSEAAATAAQLAASQASAAAASAQAGDFQSIIESLHLHCAKVQYCKQPCSKCRSCLTCSTSVGCIFKKQC